MKKIKDETSEKIRGRAQFLLKFVLTAAKISNFLN